MLFTIFLICIIIAVVWTFLETGDMDAIGFGIIFIGIIWAIGTLINSLGVKKDVITPIRSPITNEVTEFRFTRYSPAIMPEWAVESKHYKPGSKEYEILIQKEKQGE